MVVNSPKMMVIRGTGVLSCPLGEFADGLQERFPQQLSVLCHEKSVDGWTWFINCNLIRTDGDTLAEIKDYLQIYFPSDVDGEIEIENNAYPLFDVVPGVFFVLNVTDDECSKVQIQLIDRFGRARRSQIVVAGDRDVVIDNVHVPQSVIDAGFRQPVGTGDFVDFKGVQVLPRDFDKFRSAE